MTRLSDEWVIQRVGDDRLVLVNDSRGSETVIPIEVAERLSAALPYLLDPDKATTVRRWETVIEDEPFYVTVTGQGVPVAPSLLALMPTLSVRVTNQVGDDQPVAER